MDGIIGDVATAVGLVTTLASTYFGYLGVRHLIRRRHGGRPEGEPVAQPLSGPTGSVAAPGDNRPGAQGAYDVFVSYADTESGAAERLAGCLREADASVFLVRWVEPGLIPLMEAERALEGAALGVLLFGRTTMDDARIADEYAALLQRAHQGGLRFVPAPVDDVTLPAFAAVRQPVDLRAPGSARYEAEVGRLMRIVRGRRRVPDA
ncbi:toll/interleukin-1 receptor domain-containing protein [Streptomyces rhizosphaerihabitans]|uniref:toll/interleukin-1 receptor domain-containing protein n=1 Tax=Streptomyces rhizosphaerihabitans TaxID=1266770 RepID=UPI0021BEC2BA|nr:toll/interleukin-1 receptor domain-containing protein [Streptomyces rhizosphaerihabitans]MCT9007661.1 toll/interleukin-1 receptor domain-containing protein [Streptomyces rhizosphaerihabitans]